MRPVDPRLLRYARSTRAFLALSVVLGVVIGVLVIVQARLLSTAIVDVAQGGLTLDAVGGTLIALAAVIAARALVSWLGEASAYRTSARAKSELRESALALGGQRLLHQREYLVGSPEPFGRRMEVLTHETDGQVGLGRQDKDEKSRREGDLALC